MSTKTGLIFARVQSKSKAQRNNFNGWDYSLSNGASMFLPNPNLKIGSWNFFEVSMDKFKTMHYVSHCPLSTEDGTTLDNDIALLKQQSHEVAKFWRELEQHERECIMRELGIATSALFAVGAGVAGVSAIGTALATECLLTAATGGLSLILSAAVAGGAYLQYEQLKERLEAKTSATDLFNKKRERFALSLQQHVPDEYSSLELFDPQVQTLVKRLQLIFEDFDFIDMFFDDESDLTWYHATA
jgi:hypothetical protein